MKIGTLTLISQKSHSEVYREILNDKTYCLKKYSPWDSCTFAMIERSYNYYKLLENKEGLVTIFDFWKENDSMYIRMEYLSDYITFEEWSKLRKPVDEIIPKIIKIISNLMIQQIIPSDCGEGNFMVNEQLDVKMIDLDLLYHYDISNLIFIGKMIRTWNHKLQYCKQYKGKL